MKYLIKDTTKEERQELVERAIAISLSGAIKPSKKVLDLINEYIDGNLELKEIQKLIIKEHSKNA